MLLLPRLRSALYFGCFVKISVMWNGTQPDLSRLKCRMKSSEKFRGFGKNPALSIILQLVLRPHGQPPIPRPNRCHAPPFGFQHVRSLWPAKAHFTPIIFFFLEVAAPYPCERTTRRVSSISMIVAAS